MSSYVPGRPPTRGWPVASAWLVALAVAAAQGWGALHRPLADRFADLQVYRGAVRGLVAGGSLYDFAASTTGAPFTYPPFAGLLFAPLALLAFPVVAAGWWVATLAVVVALAFVAVRRSEYRHVGAPLLTALVAVALFASAPVSSNIRFGQVSVFLVAVIMVDALQVVPLRYRGIATGVAAAVKLTPLIFVPYYWLSGQRRTALTATGTFVGCTAAAWAVLPGESARFWLTEVWNVNRVGNIATGGNQSLNGALLRWAVPDSTRSVVVGLVGLTVVALGLYRAVRAYRNDRPLVAAVLVGAAGLVLSPVSWTHHQVWLVLAVLAPVSSRPRANLAWVALVLAVMVLPVPSLAALPGGSVLADGRLWLAVAIATAVPFVAVRRPSAEPVGRPGRP